MIGIIGAMDVEVKAIIDLMEDKKEEQYSSILFTKGFINKKEVVIAKCGIGKVFAAMCATIMINKYNPEFVLNVGVGGTLSEKLNIGSIAISSGLVQHDMDTSPLGDPVGLISGINIVEIKSSEEIVETMSKTLKELDIPFEVGVIASGDQFINNSDKKEYIKKEFNAIACEMEGAAIAQVCYVLNKPFCVIRAISDSADGNSHMDYSEFIKLAVNNSQKVINKFFSLLK